MFIHSIKLMGPEYVVMLGVWWGVAVFLTVLAMAAKRAVVQWSERRKDARFAIVRRLDG